MIKNNKLFIGEISASDLASKYSTPLYVYDEEIIRQRYRSLGKYIAYKPLKIYYACKANTNFEILKVLQEEGCGIDAVSVGEIAISLKAGFKPEQIVFTGNNITDEEMKYGIENAILQNIDSLSQLERYGKLNPGSKIWIRINPDVGAGHHSHTITGGPDSKFGIYFDKADEAKAIAKKYDLKIIGLHQHIGSGILNPSDFVKAMDVLTKVAFKFPDLECIDFGGGIGIPYKPTDKAIDMAEFGKKVGEIFTDFSKKYGRQVTLTIEPGRYLVAESGVLLARVNTTKETPKHKFAGVDSGFNQLIRPAMYGSYHEIIKADEVESKNKEPVIIAGNVCESGDVFTLGDHGEKVGRDLPKLNEGDLIALMNAGAYGFSMASNYNLRPLPAEIMVKGKDSRVIRKRQTIQDLI